MTDTRRTQKVASFLSISSFVCVLMVLAWIGANLLDLQGKLRLWRGLDFIGSIAMLALPLTLLLSLSGLTVGLVAQRRLRKSGQEPSPLLRRALLLATTTIALFLLGAVFAAPLFMRTATTNEGMSVGSLRTIVAAEVSYKAACWKTPAGKPVGYSRRLADLGGIGGCDHTTSTATCLIDFILANASTPGTAKSGYYFVYERTKDGEGYTVHGNPAVPGKTGERYYFVDESGVIRFNPSRPSSVSDSPLQ